MDMRDFMILAEGYGDTLEHKETKVLREEAPPRPALAHWIDDGCFEAQWEETNADTLGEVAKAIYEAEELPVYCLNGMMFPGKRQALRAITSLAQS
jgi:hypothetical protein